MSNFITPNELLPIMDEGYHPSMQEGLKIINEAISKVRFPVDIDKDLTGPIGEHGDVIHCRIWNNWRKPLKHLELMKTLRLLSMILGFSWLVVFGGPCVTWALKMYAFYLVVLNDG